MPNTLYGDEPNGILKQVAIGVITAAILGVWAFATTRASSQDMKELEERLSAKLQRALDNPLSDQ